MKLLAALILCTSALLAQTPLNKITTTAKTVFSEGLETEQLVWIYFTDKGTSLQKYYSVPSEVVSERSLRRRAKYLPQDQLIDFTDLPVNQNYITELKKLGLRVKHVSRWFNSVSGYINYSKARDLAALSFVSKIDVVAKLKKNFETEGSSEKPENYISQPEGVHTFNYGNSFTQVNQINIPALHDMGYNAQGVMIGVFDAGFNRLQHEVFAGMDIIAAWDFVNNDPDVGDGSDMGTGSHGTNTLSAIGGFKDAKLIGPAFGAAYILAKTENTDSETPIEEDNWIAALEWADSIGVDLTSTSLGYIDYDSPYIGYTWINMNGNTAPITIAADLAVKKGIAVFNSAGNEGFHADHNTLGAPADGDSVIAVGAVNSSGTRSSFSSVGNTPDGRIKPDIMAMGSSVTVASSWSNTTYTTSSGTSFSCPLAAGAAAVLLGINPNLSPIQLRTLLYNTSSNSETPNREYGYGIVNALAAFNNMPLPVELVSFEARRVSNKIELNWSTASESNNKGFEIERSADGTAWNVIAFVQGRGTTVEPAVYSFTDESAGAAVWYYRLKQLDYDGRFSYSKTVEVNGSMPLIFKLEQNYPNPFNPATNLTFNLPAKSAVRLVVYNLLGEKTAVLVNDILDAGSHSVRFNASSSLPAGIYFAELRAGDSRNVIKMNLLK